MSYNKKRATNIPMVLGPSEVRNITATEIAIKAQQFWATLDSIAINKNYNEEEEVDMNTYNEVPQQRNFLENRLCNIVCQHGDTLRKQFHLDGDDAPVGVENILKRLADGKFEFASWMSEPAKKAMQPYELFGSISWRDPAVPADQAGFDVASEKMSKARQNVVDQIRIIDPKDALKAVQEFETATFH